MAKGETKGGDAAKARLEEALRANLARRKQQSRARADMATRPARPETADNAGDAAIDEKPETP